MSQVIRRPEIRRRRKRRATLKALKLKLKATTNPAKLEALMKRFRKVALAAHLREFTQGNGGHQSQQQRPIRKAA